jgi:hypothetical protein
MENSGLSIPQARPGSAIGDVSAKIPANARDRAAHSSDNTKPDTRTRPGRKIFVRL